MHKKNKKEDIIEDHHQEKIDIVDIDQKIMIIIKIKMED